MDYGDIIFDQSQNESFWEKIESVQYKAALAITGAIQTTSRKKICQKLGLESLKSRRWYRWLSCMFKIMKKEALNYLINLISKCEKTIRIRNNHIPIYTCWADYFKYSFFPCTLNDGLNLDVNVGNSESISISIFKACFLYSTSLKQHLYLWPARIEISNSYMLSLVILMSIDFDIILESAWILYAPVVWRLKVHLITHSTAIIFPTITLILCMV